MLKIGKKIFLNLPKEQDKSTTPKQPTNNFKKPVVIFFYGGCWGACLNYKKSSYAFLAQTFTSKGYLVVIPDYRHYPQVLFAEIMQDAAKATEWVQANISAYGGDKTQLILLGHSAGAHIAAMLTLDETWLNQQTLSSVKGFIGLAGPYDFLPFTEAYLTELFGPKEHFPNSQPINFVDGTEAPLLLLHGNDDRRVKPKNLQSLSRVITNKGGTVQSHRYDGISHTKIIAALSKFSRNHEAVMQNIENFLQKITSIEK